MDKKLMIFDLDGVIVDSLDCMNFVWSKIKDKYCLPEFSIYAKQIGIPFPDIMKIIGVNKKVDEIQIEYFELTKKYSNLVKLYPGIMDLLYALLAKNIDIAIVTSKSRENTKNIIEKFNIPCNKYICGDDLAQGKPSPLPILEMLKISQKNPSDAIYVGDMPVDYIASQSAGVDFYFANWGYGEILNDQKFTTVNYPSDLLSIFLKN